MDNQASASQINSNNVNKNDDDVKDDQLLKSIRCVQSKKPGIGWKKIWQEINKTHNWNIDKRRMKVLMKEHGLINRVPPKKIKEPRIKVGVPPPTKKKKTETTDDSKKGQKDMPKNQYSTEQLMVAIQKIKKEHPDYGVRSVWSSLQKEYPGTKQNKVKRYMKRLMLINTCPSVKGRKQQINVKKDKNTNTGFMKNKLSEKAKQQLDILNKTKKEENVEEKSMV